MTKLTCLLLMYVAWLLPQQLTAQTTGTPEADIARERSPSEVRSAFGSALGILTGGEAYLAFLSISSIADSYGCRAYSAEQSLALAASINGVLEQSSQELRRIAIEVPFSSTQQDVLLQLLDVIRSLQDAVAALRRYIATDSPDLLSDFQKKKNQAWDNIELLIGKEGGE